MYDFTTEIYDENDNEVYVGVKIVGYEAYEPDSFDVQGCPESVDIEVYIYDTDEQIDIDEDAMFLLLELALDFIKEEQEEAKLDGYVNE